MTTRPGLIAPVVVAGASGRAMARASAAAIRMSVAGRVVMEKGAGWGADSGNRTGDWQFQWFRPDRTINLSETTSRCQSCHESRSGTDFLFTHGDMIGAK